jgi:hypothetical protein
MGNEKIREKGTFFFAAAAFVGFAAGFFVTA